jgi:hypothetical protein
VNMSCWCFSNFSVKQFHPFNLNTAQMEATQYQLKHPRTFCPKHNMIKLLNDIRAQKVRKLAVLLHTQIS